MEYRIDGSANWYPMTNITANPKLWSAGWDSSTLAQGDHTIEVRATSNTGSTSSNIITTRVLQPQPTPQVQVDSLKTGKYTTQKKTTSFVESSEFFQGDTVVFRAHVASGGMPVAGATVTLSITGVQTVNLVTTASSSEGIAEAKWATKAPSKRSLGTPKGLYTATATGVTATGYSSGGPQPSINFLIK